MSFIVRITILIQLTTIALAIASPKASIKRTESMPSLKPKSNILFLIGMSSHSHRTAIEPLGHELVSRGHNVTFLTAIRPTKPNPKFHEFSTESVNQFYNEVLTTIGNDFFPSRLQDKNANAIPNPDTVSEFTLLGAQLYFNSPEFKPWIQSSNFDLVIIDNAANRFGLVLAYIFKARVILYSGAGFFSPDEEVFGVASESSWLPNYFLTNVFTEKLTLYDKIYSTLYPIYYKISLEWWTYPKLEALARSALQIPEMPSITELEQETSLLFTNLWFSHDYARSLPPLVVQIGGMHCEKSNGSLPKEMENFIARAGDNGFIFISFGTIVHMSKMPDYLRQVFFDTIKSFKTRFLWKWDVEPPKNLPSNVFAAKWFPQQDILAHPKIKGFVTHAGLMSVQQGVCHGVPMIAIPVFGDQPYNAKTIAHHKIGIHLELSELTTDVFTSAIGGLIQNPDYALNAERASELFNDRPMSAVDTAAYWTEYVLRHKNTSHLKPLAVNQTWWEKRLLDVWLSIFALLIILICITCKILKLVLRLYFEKRRDNTEKLKIQ